MRIRIKGVTNRFFLRAERWFLGRGPKGSENGLPGRRTKTLSSSSERLVVTEISKRS